MVLYAANDRSSFQTACSLLHRLRSGDNRQGVTLVLVANKTDLVRGREVAEAGESRG